MTKRIITAALAAMMVLAALCLTGCGEKDSITIGSKQYTESILIGEMYAQLIEEHSDVKVVRKLNLGGTSVCMSALKEGEIDACPMYTGTLYNEVLNHELDAGVTTEDIRETCRTEMDEQFDITMFDPQGQNNTYALAIKSSRQAELGAYKISDLAGISSSLRFGADHIFYTRVHDGYDGLVATYGLSFKEALKMDGSLLYEAVDSGDLDVVEVFSTDSLLKKYELTCLEDDLGLFPPYEGVLVCRNEVLEKHPELEEILNSLADALDDETVQELNYQVDIAQRSVEDVAKEFLNSNGYIG